MRMSSLPKFCSIALKHRSIDSSLVISSWIGLTFIGAPILATAISPLCVSWQPIRTWCVDGCSVAIFFTISYPIPAFPPEIRTSVLVAVTVEEVLTACGRAVILAKCSSSTNLRARPIQQALFNTVGGQGLNRLGYSLVAMLISSLYNLYTELLVRYLRSTPPPTACHN